MKAVKTKLVLLVLCFMVFGQKAGAQCSFSIKASVTKICEKEVVEFSIINAPSASSIKEINWDFGFKQVKNNNNPIVIYNSKGVYDVVLTVKTSTSCTVTESKLITVNELPDMGKVASSKKEACAPGSRVQFSSTSVNAYKWHWVVESEYYTGKNANINHKMENEGWPYVQLTVESVEGCKNKFIFDSLVHVLSKPVVDFDKTELLLCELPGTLKVKPKIDYKGTTIKSHAWDFEGATVSVDYKKNPSDKYYVKAGQYDVNLELISAKGCRFEYEFKDTVDVIDIAKSNIVARSLTKSGCPSMRYKVVVGGIDTSLFKWDYPKNDVLWVDSTQKDSTVFYFKNEGTHTVKVVINQGPCKSVYPLKLKAAIGLVKADFAAPKCLCDPQSIFKAKNKSVGNGKLSYEWLINSENGLKITSTDSNLSKVIGIPGKYNVFLKATHKNGCYDYEGRILRIKKNEVTADHIRDEACMVDNFTLPLDSFCNVDTNKLYWFFYNENKKLVWQDTGISVRVEFPDTGYYSVAVVVNSTTGCSDSAYFQKHIYVKDCFGDISASFSYVEGCAGKIVMPLLTETISQFKVNAVLVLQSDTTVTYSGTFKFPFLNFIVQKAGIYNLKVRVSSKDGSIYKDYYEKSIVYVNKLTIQGEIGKSWGCFPEKHTELKTTLIKNELFYGTDSSVDLRWRIYPHDKGYINNDTARNTYSVVYEQGQVDIELKAENRTGCKAKWQSVNKLNENLKVEFFMPENACFGDTIFMNNQSTGPIQKWEWSSDNSNDLFLPNSAIKKPEFKAKAEGKRTIELTVIDTNGCVSSISKEINLVDIELDFTVEDTTAKCSPATYFFQAKGKKVQQFEWDFGDGDQLKTKKTKKIPKIYDLRRINPYQNTFTVTLTGSHSSGCTQKVVKPNLIKIKGPWPKFEISNIKGCSPLKVSFTDKSENVHKLYFDYGDRTSVDTVLNAEHIYKADTTKEVEYFKPYIVAHDKFDCRTAYFLDDTVKVFSMPVARFIGSPRTGCEPLTTKLRSNSRFAHSHDWQIPTAGVNDQGVKSVNILKAGVYDVELKVQNKVGCTHTITKPKVFTVYKNPNASFVINDTIACINRKLKLTSTSSSGVGLAQHKWLIKVADQIDSARGNEFSPILKQSGPLSAQLIVIDNNNCTDTAYEQNAARVYEKLPVKTSSIQFVSHLSNNEIEVAWDSINTAFLRQVGVYAGVGPSINKIEVGRLNSRQLQINNDSFANQSNWFVLELIDKCTDVYVSDTHKTVHLMVNRNNVKATELSWTPYKGWINVAYYTIYRASENNNYRPLATVPSWQTSYVDSSFCDSIYNYLVLAVDSVHSFKSNSNSLWHKTEYTYQNEPLQLLLTTVQNDKQIVTTWHKGKQLGKLEYQISKQEQLSGKNKVWQTTTDTFISDSNALINDFYYTYQVKVKDKCGNLAGKSNIGRSILLNVNQNNNQVESSWNPYKIWLNGVKEYIVEVKPPNAKWFTQLGITTDTFIIDEYAYLNYEEPYYYRVKAIENGENPDTSYSNTRMVIPVPSMFAANAFSPNGDGLNDYFTIEGWALLEDIESINEFSLKIYNRWGERVFESHDISQGWDGTFKSTDCQLDQYIWHAKVTALNGEIYFLRGGVLLMR